MENKTTYDLHVEVDGELATVTATSANGRKTRKHYLTRNQRKVLDEVLACCRGTMFLAPPAKPDTEPTHES